MLKRLISRYLLLSGILLNVGAMTAVSAGIYKLHQADVSVSAAVYKVASIVDSRVPVLAAAMRSIVQVTNPELQFESMMQFEDMEGIAGADFSYIASAERSTSGTNKAISVASSMQFRNALRKAEPGDVITLQKGTYRFDSKLIPIGKSGAPGKPIRVIAERLGEVTLRLNTVEGFYVNQPYWQFENLKIEGECTSDSRCEHAFHVVGEAHHFLLKNNIVTDFNAAIKVNGTSVNGRRVYPDFGRIEFNSIYNHKVRDTSNPVTFIDILAVNGWIVRKNFIADFVKGRGNKISYGGFFKGGGTDNTFEQNFIACRFNLQKHSGVQVGLSFGGGGSSQNVCRNGSCDAEHYRGTIRNNVVTNCNDVGIYLNKSVETEIYNNTLINTLGIDVRYSQSSAVIANNILTGRIKNRNNGRSEEYANFVFDVGDLPHYFKNLSVGDLSLFDDKEVRSKGVQTIDDDFDFCDNKKSSKTMDIGAIQYGVNSVPCRLF